MAQGTELSLTGDLYKAIVTIIDERVREIRVTREDFDALTSAVRQLAEAQARTEARLEELAEAQARTEKRLDSLAAKVEQLAEAQALTEKRLDSLAAKVEQLAEAQVKTEKVVRGLVVDMREVKRQLGGLSNTVGYGLEDRAIRALPAILKSRLGLDVRAMDRRFLEYPDGKDDEINIYGEGVLEGEPVVVIGESKAHLGPKDVDRFRKMLERVRMHLGRRLVPLLVVYSVRPKVEEYARRYVPDLLLFKSYEF